MTNMTINKYKTQPYKHQLDYLTKFGRSKVAALLADMGTGKSWMIINNVADLWASNDCDAVFILAPSGVHTNWTRLEIPKHMPDWVQYKAVAWKTDATKKFKAELDELYVPKERQLRIFTMNWEGLQHKRSFEEALKFCSLSRRLMIVCDESDAVKNPATARYKALIKLKKFSYWRRIMSGTPINNSPFDAFSQFSFLDENILQTTSYYEFKTEYAEMMASESRLIQKIAKNKVPWRNVEIKKLFTSAIDIVDIIYRQSRDGALSTAANNVLLSVQNGDYDSIPEYNEKLRGLFNPDTQSAAKTECLKMMVEMDKIVVAHKEAVHRTSSSKRMPQIVDTDKKTGRKKYKNLDRLSRLIAPHSFRVLKTECLDLPEKIYKTAFFDLTKEQTEAYKKAEDECRIVFEGQETPFSKLTAVIKLAQITSGYYIHPLATEPVRIAGGSPKLDLLASRVESIVNSGEKAIVWARYTTEIKDIVARLRADGHNVVEYYGDIKKTERIEAIEEFENGSADIFVGNQQAGGTGITLVAASYVIYFSNSFSLRDRLQSEDRAHRIGQKKNVTYINLIASGTIDEAIVGALMNKQDVADTIINKGLKLFSQS
jgi:SNF2 family DNA or RNA helicase